MAVLDTVSDLQNITTGARLTIQPGSGVEWIIHNIFAAADVSVEFYDGSSTLVLDSSPTTGRWWENLQLHLTNTKYLRVLNNNAASKLIGYTGVVSK